MKKKGGMMPFQIVFVSVLMIIFFGALSQADSLPIKKIESVIEKNLKAQGIPGLSIAVYYGDEYWSQGYGLADIENEVPVGPKTMFRLASVSKPLTATALLTLVEKGKIDLDQPIQNYCPSYPEKSWAVTIRQLLGHLGGVRSYSSSEEANASTIHFRDIITPLGIFDKDPLVHAPGTKFLYTTYGYNLLGCAVQGAALNGFMDYLKRSLFTPAQMRNIQADDSEKLIMHRAQGYVRNRVGKLVNSNLADTSNKIPGGGLISTSGDLVKFARALQAGQILSKKWIDEMWTSQKTASGEETGYGMGWDITYHRGRREIWHRGGQERVSTILYLIPEKALSIAILTNLEGGKTTPIAQAVAEEILR